MRSQLKKQPYDQSALVREFIVHNPEVGATNVDGVASATLLPVSVHERQEQEEQQFPTCRAAAIHF